MVLTPKNSALVIIDIQERLCKAMPQDVLARTCRQINLLATLAEELKIPIILTEQYPEGLGPTIGAVKTILEGKKFSSLSKITFGCCGDKKFTKLLQGLKRKNLILTGMETHVCVYLTALELKKKGYQPLIASDAVLSREKFYYLNGLELMRNAGSVISNTETLLFQLMVQSGTPTFKKISQLLKSTLSSSSH